MPLQDDTLLMEHLVLDGAQCGLSWATILAKRNAYAAAFKNYDISAIAAMVCWPILAGNQSLGFHVNSLVMRTSLQ